MNKECFGTAKQSPSTGMTGGIGLIRVTAADESPELEQRASLLDSDALRTSMLGSSKAKPSASPDFRIKKNKNPSNNSDKGQKSDRPEDVANLQKALKQHKF